MLQCYRCGNEISQAVIVCHICELPHALTRKEVVVEPGWHKISDLKRMLAEQEKRRAETDLIERLCGEYDYRDVREAVNEIKQLRERLAAVIAHVEEVLSPFTEEEREILILDVNAQEVLRLAKGGASG